MYGAGEWLQEKHGARARRNWRKLHLAVDAASGMIVAQTLTAKEIGDPSQVGALLDQIQGDVEQVTADGAYDGAPTYQMVAQHGAQIRILIPPHVTAVLSDEVGQGPSQRDGHIALIEAKGRLEWQKRPAMAAARSWKPPSVDTNGLLARNFERSRHRRRGSESHA